MIAGTPKGSQRQTLGDGYHGGIDDSKREVCVVSTSSAMLDVLVLQFSNVKAIAAERFQEGGFRLRSSVPCRATTCLHAQRRAALMAAVSFCSSRVPPRVISSSIRYAVGTDATCPNASA
jgi:hypothetical protein